MKNRYKKFKKQLKWFKNKVNQSDFWNYVDYNFNDEMFDYTFEKLFRNYKPLFKKSSSVKFFYSDDGNIKSYNLSWSFEDLKYNQVNERKAHRLVFRITKNINGKTRTLYRYYITLNNFFNGKI